MTARRILTIFGTRPEAIKLFPLLHALEGDSRFVSVACVSAQHRVMLDQVLSIAGIVPAHDLDLMRPDQTLDALTAALHCAPTEVSAAALRRENVAPATVHVTGNTVIDALHWIVAKNEEIGRAHV